VEKKLVGGYCLQRLAQGKKKAAQMSSFFCLKADNLFVTFTTLGRAFSLGFMTTLAECVASLHAPLFICREVGAFMADIAFIFSLMLGMGEGCGFFGCFGFQGDDGRALVWGSDSIVDNSKTENKRESGGTDNAFLHCSSPIIQLVYKIGAY